VEKLAGCQFVGMGGHYSVLHIRGSTASFTGCIFKDNVMNVSEANIVGVVNLSEDVGRNVGARNVVESLVAGVIIESTSFVNNSAADVTGSGTVFTDYNVKTDDPDIIVDIPPWQTATLDMLNFVSAEDEWLVKARAVRFYFETMPLLIQYILSLVTLRGNRHQQE
jgi:hypothetical protein